MAVSKTTKTSPAKVPQSNINAFVRVPGHPPTALGKALQEWDNVTPVTRWVSDPETPSEKRREFTIQFREGDPTFGGDRTYEIAVSEQIYEAALYTRATKRFTDWMRANGKNR